MSMYNLDLFAYNDVSKYRKEREHGGECGFAMDDEEGHMVDFESVGEISYSGAALVGMCYHNDFVTAIDEFRG